MVFGSEADKAEILRVIEEETAAYFAKDFDRWASCWVHEPHVRRYGWYARGGTMISNGWEEEAAHMRLSMQHFPAPNRSGHDLRRENINIRVDGDVAWATFDQIGPSTGDPFDVPGIQHEMRALERHEGQWKIAGTFVLGSTLEFVSSPLLRVDERGTVLWMNRAAEEELKQHWTLVIGAGRLKARNRAADQRLQASFLWASGLKGYAERQVARSVVPTMYGVVPVMLGETEQAMLDI